MLSKVSDCLDVKLKSVTAANFMWQFKVAKVKLLTKVKIINWNPPWYGLKVNQKLRLIRGTLTVL